MWGKYDGYKETQRKIGERNPLMRSLEDSLHTHEWFDPYVQEGEKTKRWGSKSFIAWRRDEMSKSWDDDISQTNGFMGQAQFDVAKSNFFIG